MLLILTLCLIILSGCQVEQPLIKPTKDIFILLDFTASFKNQKLKHAEIINTILDSITIGDRVYIMKITNISETEMLKKFKTEPATGANEFTLKIKLRQLQPKLDSIKILIADELNSFFKSENTYQATDIRGALRRVSEINPGESKLIFIISDMIEETQSLNLLQVKLDNKKIEEIIEHDHQNQSIPNLTNSKTIITGLNAPNIEKLQEIKKFWREYLKKAGTEVFFY